MIENLKRENGEMRDELQTRLSVADQLQRFQPNAAPVEPKVDTPPAGDRNLSDEDLIARIRQVAQTEREQERVTANLNTVAARLVELYGSDDKAKEVVAQKASELGVSVQFLQSVAQTSPKAFFNQLGVDQQSQVHTPPAPRGTVNPQATTSGGVQPGSYEYYEEIRRSDPKRYFSAKTQNQLMKDAMEGRYTPR